MLSKNQNLLIRSKTPSYKRLKGSYRNLRSGKSPLNSRNKIRTNKKYSKSPIKNRNKKKIQISKQKNLSYLLKQEKQLKNKIKFLKKEEISLKKVFLKCEKEKNKNLIKFENEKNQILEIFTKFLMKKQIKLSLTEKRNKSFRKNSMRDISKKNKIDRKSSKSVKKFSFTKKNSMKNNYIKIDKKKKFVSKKKFVRDGDIFFVFKDVIKGSKKVSSNVKLLERFGMIGKL